MEVMISYAEMVFFFNNKLLQNAITARIPAAMPAAIPSARIAIGKAAELGVDVADEEVDEAEELVTTRGVTDVVGKMMGAEVDVDAVVIGNEAVTEAFGDEEGRAVSVVSVPVASVPVTSVPVASVAVAVSVVVGTMSPVLETVLVPGPTPISVENLELKNSSKFMSKIKEI